MATTGTTQAAVRPKEFHFPLSVEWIGERRVAVLVEGKPAIEVTPPPVFRGTDPATWSPEDFLVGAAASCLAVTFTGLAARAGLSYTKLKVDADGVAGTRRDGRFGFTRLLLRLQVETEQAQEARRLATQAEETCLVSASLDLPVETEIDVRRPPTAYKATAVTTGAVSGRTSSEAISPCSTSASQRLPASVRRFRNDASRYGSEESAERRGRHARVRVDRSSRHEQLTAFDQTAPTLAAAACSAAPSLERARALCLTSFSPEREEERARGAAAKGSASPSCRSARP
jgi:organic hydroperoxide reductase OsmC/OhrA